MKHRIVHALQKYLLNPPIKLLSLSASRRRGMRSSKRLVARRGRRDALRLATRASAISSGSWQSTA